MDTRLFEWILSLFNFFAELSNWLVTPLFLGISPLSLFSVVGFTTFLGLLAGKFVISMII
jgi:hypothetical protein